MTDPRDLYTIDFGGERLMLGAIAEPTLTELVASLLEATAGIPRGVNWEAALGSEERKRLFYARGLKLIHYSLRFANSHIDESDASVEYLAAKLPAMSHDQFCEAIDAIVEFSKRHNSARRGIHLAN